MTSMSIYNTPYFYIIQHKETKMLYAGSRFAKGCHPDEFMKVYGYTTSSSIINLIIENYNIDVFDVIRVDTYCDNIHPYDYESIFLQTMDCASSAEWYNTHNNSGECPAYGTTQFKKLMLLKYGNENYNNIGQNKITCLERYGVDHPNKRQSERPRMSDQATELNKRKDMVERLAERNRINNPSKFPENRLIASIRFTDVNNKMLREGTHPMQKQLNKDNASARMKTTMANLPVLECPHCHMKGKGSNMTRWHFDNCKLKS